MFLKQLIFVLFSVEIAFSWRVFNRGRNVGGSLGEPGPTTHPNYLENHIVEEKWFTQILDHFNPTDTRTWEQRYYTNELFYDFNSGGPVFLMIGGEGEATSKWMTQGTWIVYAKRFGALCFQLEHRYYGKSHPTKDLSTKNLEYLTSQQALADLANFIISMNQKYHLKTNTKWIVFGGSYPGSLAAWMRLKYPHLVHGAMSASGPLLAQVDFSAYYRVVVESLETYSTACVDSVKAATAALGALFKTQKGIAYLNRQFRVCDPLEKSVKNHFDVANFYDTLSGNFAGVVQYNKDNRVGSNVKAANITIDTLCDIMTNKKVQLVERLSNINSMLLEAYDQKCLDYKYDKMIDELRTTSWDSTVSEGGRQWYYQTCTEFGFFQTSSYGNHIFGKEFPVEFFIQQCIDVFGTRFNETFINNSADRTNMIYGALDIEASNIVFVHGSIDPWHALGITHMVNQGAPAIYIEGTAHCANMYPETENDLPQLKEAREEIAQYIDSWIRL